MTFFSHGTVDEGISLGYHTMKSKEFEVNEQRISEYNPNAFDGRTCLIDVYACNIATPRGVIDKDNGDPLTSLGAYMSVQTQSLVGAYWGRTEYAYINAGQPLSDVLDRKILGFSPYGSYNLPTTGYKYDRVTPSKKMIFDGRKNQGNR